MNTIYEVFTRFWGYMMSSVHKYIMCVVSFIFNSSMKLSPIFPISQMKQQKFMNNLPKITQFIFSPANICLASIFQALNLGPSHTHFI